MIGLINLATKCAGTRSAGNPHAACDVAGPGNGATVRTEAPVLGESRRQLLLPGPTATVPGPDPTHGSTRRNPASEGVPFKDIKEAAEEAYDADGACLGFPAIR